MTKATKLRSYNAGDTLYIPLLVLNATEKLTKHGKAYLQLHLYDGTDEIIGNVWDWNGHAITIEKNMVLDVSGQMTEYMGKRQLNIKTITINKDIPTSKFMRSSGQDVEAVYAEAVAFIEEIKDKFLHDLASTTLNELQSLWKTVPGAATIHHAYVAGTLIHSLSVAKLAKAMAQQTGACVELAAVGGLLHDVGKLFSYYMNGAVCELSDKGILLDHTFIGARFVANLAETIGLEEHVDKIDLLCHIILSHHGRLEHGAVVPPRSLEAHIVHFADALDAKAEIIRTESKKLGNVKWTDRIWALENSPYVTNQFTAAVFSNPDNAV